MILTAVKIGRTVVLGGGLIKASPLFDQHMNELSLLQGADGPITDDNSSSVFRGFRECRTPMLNCLHRSLIFSNSSLDSRLARTVNVHLCPLKLMPCQFGKVYGSAVDRLPTSFIQALVGIGTLVCL